MKVAGEKYREKEGKSHFVTERRERGEREGETGG